MPPHTPTSPADSLLRKRERDRRAQQNVRNKRAAHVGALEQRVAALEGELRSANGTCRDLRREVDILRGRQGSLQSLVASWGDGSDILPGIPESHPEVQRRDVGLDVGDRLPSLPAVTHHRTESGTDETPDNTRGPREQRPPVVALAPVPPAPEPAAAPTPATPHNTGSLTPPRWNMLPAHTPDRGGLSMTNRFSTWLRRPDLARASPESPQPLELLFGSKKNFLANTIFEAIQQWPCREVERLALGWLTYHMIKWMVQPSEGRFARVPEFQHPTMEQLCRPHPHYIDFLFWPVLRANLVKNQGVYDDLDVVGMTTCCIKVRWPWNAPFLEPNDDNQFVLKPKFFDTITKLGGWGLTKEFFDRFPLLVEGIDPSVRYEIC